MALSLSVLVIKILYTKGHQGVVCVFPVSGGALGFESWKVCLLVKAVAFPVGLTGKRGALGPCS